MAKDNYNAVWVSHSSMGDFLKCPRLYYLRNIHKDPVSRNKITIIEPALALGQIVHEVIEDLSKLPAEERMESGLLPKFTTLWEKVSGEKGGFKNEVQEKEYKERGERMIRRIKENPGPILEKAVKIKSPDSLPPRYTLSEDDNIILCGKIDWLKYDESSNSVQIIDFKTSRSEEAEESLQLPIYYLLAKNLQKRPILSASYWYLEFEKEPKEVNLESEEKITEEVLKIAKRIKLARQLEHFNCPKDGCRYCAPYEQVLAGEGKFVGVSDYQDIYALI